jgi:hypothetical protein
MKKIKKNIKRMSNSKTGLIRVGYENYLYVKSVGIKSEKRTEAGLKFDERYKLPTKKRMLQPFEVEALNKELKVKNVTNVLYEIDSTSKEYKRYIEERDLFVTMLEIAINIDGDVKAYEDEQGNEIDVWDFLDLPKNDYFELTMYLAGEDGLNPSAEDVSIMIKEIEKIKSGMPTLGEIENGLKDFIISEEDLEEEVDK